jgi:hypothetical protein
MTAITDILEILATYKINKIRRELYDLRLTYIQNTINHFHNIRKNCILSYPTGSTNLTSDQDIQITLNINGCNTTRILHKIIEKIHTIINKGNQIWCNDIETFLDAHFYPPSLINFIPLSEKTNGYKYVRTSTNNKLQTKVCLFLPQLSTETLIHNFYQNENKMLKKQKQNNSKLFYKNYKDKIANCLHDVISCYQKKKQLSDQVFNDKLHCLVEYNAIGPDMYLTISSVIIVVWNMQMKNTLSPNLLQIFAPIAYQENKLIYQKTKNPKYKHRYMYCQKIIESYSK